MLKMFVKGVYPYTIKFNFIIYNIFFSSKALFFDKYCNKIE